MVWRFSVHCNALQPRDGRRGNSLSFRFSLSRTTHPTTPLNLTTTNPPPTHHQPTIPPVRKQYGLTPRQLAAASRTSQKTSTVFEKTVEKTPPDGSRTLPARRYVPGPVPATVRSAPDTHRESTKTPARMTRNCQKAGSAPDQVQLHTSVPAS